MCATVQTPISGFFFASGAARTDNVRQLASSLLRLSVIEIGVQLHVKNVNIIS